MMYLPTAFKQYRALRFEYCEPRHVLAPLVGIGVYSSADLPCSLYDEIVLRENDDLGQIALALLNHESARRYFPSHAIYSQDSEPLLSWRVSVLPYLGYGELYSQFHLDEPWDSPHNYPLLFSMPGEFANPHIDCPSPLQRVETTYQVLVGANTLFPKSGERLGIEDVTDGVTNTVLVTEGATPVPWTKPEDVVFEELDPLNGVGPVNGAGFHAALVSAEVLEIPADVDEELWRRLAVRNDGLFVDLLQIAPPLTPHQSLRWLGVAALNFESLTLRLPAPAIFSTSGEPLLSWRVAILPLIDQYNLYQQFHLDEPWDSPHNLSLLPMMPRIYGHEQVTGGLTNYLVLVGEDTAFPVPDASTQYRGLRFRDFPDGLSNTILFVEANAKAAIEWTRPQDIDYDDQMPLGGVGDIGPTEFHVVMANADVHALPNSISPAAFAQLVSRNDTVTACDFNGDGFCTVTDLDLLTVKAGEGNNTPTFDLNGDNLVNRLDVQEWLVLAGARPENATKTGGNAFLEGDANLDGATDGSDFIAWNRNKFTDSKTWSGGNFDANAATDGSDFIIWNTLKFMTADDAAASVQQPRLLAPMSAHAQKGGGEADVNEGEREGANGREKHRQRRATTQNTVTIGQALRAAESVTGSGEIVSSNAKLAAAVIIANRLSAWSATQDILQGIHEEPEENDWPSIADQIFSRVDLATLIWF